MAYNPKLTPINAQRPRHGNYGPAYGDMPTNNPGSGQRGYSPERGHDKDRRPQPYEASYSSQVPYADHDQTPWNPQEQYSNGHRGYRPSQQDWQSGRSYGEPLHPKPRIASPGNSNEHRDRLPFPFPGSRVEGEDHNLGYDKYNDWPNHDQIHHKPREESQSRHHESQDYEHNGNGFDARRRAAPTSNFRPPRNDSNLKYGYEEDHLPRYLNHGDRHDPRQSQRGAADGAQHRHNDLLRSAKPPPSSHSRPIDPRSASSCKSPIPAPSLLVLSLITVQPLQGRKES